MKKLALVVSFIMVSAVFAAAQNAKPWTEWAKKDAEKMLNESAWGKTQQETDTSQMIFQPTANDTTKTTSKATTDDKGVASGSNAESGARNGEQALKYHIRFISAKPVREAFARMIMLNQTNEAAAKALGAKLQAAFVDLDYGDYIVIGVVPEATDRRQLGPVDQALRSATAPMLKTTCYLERKDGKRMFLVEYEPPTPDQTGAKFIFPRSLEEQPFLTEGETVRFVAEVGDKVKVNMKYKMADMKFEGKLEY